MATKLTEEQIERTQVEALIRGELDSGTVEYSYQHKYDGEKSGAFRFHYTGVPEWCASDYKDHHDADVDYFTAVKDCLWGLPPETIMVKGKRYDRVNHCQHSGETECCCEGCEPDPFDGELCPYCERAAGEKHGYIYLGDGWCEVVYRHDGIQAMRDCCERHNLQVWAEEGITFECVGSCNDTIVAPTSAVEANGGCPTCGEPLPKACKVNRNVWWWQTCSPGCLPDGEVMGPFDSEIDALSDATDGLCE